MQTILEIGGGRTPYFVRYALPMDTNTKYICLDVDSKNIERAQEALKEHQDLGFSIPNEISFNVHDAIQLPFTDQSLDLVVLSNTLTAPIHLNWDRNGTKVKIKNKEGEIIERIIQRNITDDPFYAERKPIVDEALRVLRPGGSLFIYTDLIVYGTHSYERILRELSNHPGLEEIRDLEEEIRINNLNKEKMHNEKFCCCFRAEILPECSVYEFIKK